MFESNHRFYDDTKKEHKKMTAFNPNRTKQIAPQGLKNLREFGNKELVLCTNCNCKRYGHCGCMKKGDKPAA